MKHIAGLIMPDAVCCGDMLAIGQAVYYNHRRGVWPIVRGGGCTRFRFTAKSVILDFGPNIEFIKEAI